MELGVSSALDTSKVRDEGLYPAYLSCFPQIKPSNYMKASVQLPPYKSPGLSYDQWRRSASPAASPLEVRTHAGTEDTGVTTRVEHFTDSGSQRSGTRTVTRTITPAGEMAVYASQSSVRFKMTSRSSKQQQQQSSSMSRERQMRAEGDSDEEARDLYPVTTLRSHSMREAGQPLSRGQCLPSPDFNILHRDTERTLEVREADSHRDQRKLENHHSIYFRKMTTERAALHLNKGTLWSWLLTLVRKHSVNSSKH